MNKTTATILIVDDEIKNRKLLEALLLPEGYNTVIAASGEEALALIERKAPDLVLLDLMMPGMDGYQVASIIKANPATSNIPIVIITAQIDRTARLDGLNCGAEEFLTKPVDRIELWLRVRNLLRLKDLRDLLQSSSATLERQAQERMNSLQRFRDAMDASPVGVMLVSRGSMLFVDANKTALAMLGYTSEELLKVSAAEAYQIDEEQLGRDYDEIIAGKINGNESEGIAGAKGGAVKGWVKRKDGGKMVMEKQTRAMQYGDEWHIVITGRDVTMGE
jgi:PAS domain S-box-containing protein